MLRTVCYRCCIKTLSAVIPNKQLCTYQASGCSKLLETVENLNKYGQPQGQRFLHEDSAKMLSSQFCDSLDSLKFNCCDFSYHDTSKQKACDQFNTHVQSEVESKHPESVVMYNLEESYFLHDMKKILKDLGYDSNFQQLNRGRGQATFIRQDLLRDSEDKNTTRFYKSRIPDPC